ncbi:MAG: LysR family transcriptional regulator [Desulfovibrionaceae bacterium]|nr:LysR family transcriptional regulator [Desulfovibrionaceae bacterium]
MIGELNGDFLQWLRGFYYIAHTGSIRKAAQLMNRNPSTLSYQLHSLEQELNAVLFDRRQRTLSITPEGKKLLEWTISMFETLQGLRAEVGAADGCLHGFVTISTTLPPATRMVETLASFHRKFPDVHLKIRRALTYEVVEDVESSRVDFGIAGITADPSNSMLEELFRSRPLLVLRRDNPYRLPRRPGPEDLKNLPFISFLSEGMEDEADPYFGLNARSLPYTKHSVLNVNNYHLMLLYVLQGVGAAIMDEMCVKASTSFGRNWKELATYPLDSFLPTTRYGILVRKCKHLSPQARALMEKIRTEAFVGL